jgi:hypothetical protein
MYCKISNKKTGIMIKDLCIPLPDLANDQIADVEVTVGDKKLKYHFRVESIPWDTGDELSGKYESSSLEMIYRLKKAINNYDKNWELIQIFTPPENAKFIQVLYRKKT